MIYSLTSDKAFSPRRGSSRSLRGFSGIIGGLPYNNEQSSEAERSIVAYPYLNFWFYAGSCLNHSCRRPLRKFDS